MINLSKLRSNFIRIQERDTSYVFRCLFFKKEIFKPDLKIINRSVLNSDYFYKSSGRKLELVNNIKIGNYVGAVSVQGFLHTGSSAVLDLLREFDITSVFGLVEPFYSGFSSSSKHDNEFWLYNDMRVFDIDGYLNEDYLCEQDFIIKRIIKTVDFYRCLFLEDYDIDLYFLFDKYILPFIDTQCKSICGLIEELKQWNIVGGGWLNTMDYKHNSFSFIQGINVNEIRCCCALFFNEIFRKLSSTSLFVVDQLVDCENGYDCDLHSRYLGDNVKYISVFRDPRDQYMQLVYFSTRGFETSRWFDKFLYPSVNFIDSYQNGVFPISPKKYFENPHPNRLMIRFEDLINDYENSITKICDFLGIDKSHHVNKGKYLIPEISRKNIGIYKNYHDQRVMDKIKEELGEYCYE